MASVIYPWRAYSVNEGYEKLKSLYRTKEEVGHLYCAEKAKAFLEDCGTLLFLDYHLGCPCTQASDELYGRTRQELIEAIDEDKPDVVEAFFSSLAELRQLLEGSVEAIYQGDPAAINRREVVLAYPGFQAILTYRIAHRLLELGEAPLARYLSERAHEKTGIDIHPGAKIGKDFFIDHGTGIVIGETAVIEDGVKLYQGVTLGALSLAKGRELASQKRHPTVKKGVTIYSNASIFGGDTVIGEGSTIGSNVYLTASVPDRVIVYLGKEGITIKAK